MKKFGVATKALIQNSSGKFLVLIKSSVEDINPNEADIPGGRLDFGEDVQVGLLREIEEETGIRKEFLKILCPTRTWGFVKKELHLVGITFLLELSKKIKVEKSQEHSSFKWLSKSKVLSGDYPDWLKEEIKAVYNRN